MESGCLSGTALALPLRMLLACLLACSDYELGVPSATVSEPPEEDTPPLHARADDSADEPDLADCDAGYYADYFNLPADHPEVELDEGDRTGDVPANHDWWDPAYFAFRQVDPGLEFGEEWWPVNTGLPGDPQYFAVHWVATLDVVEDVVVAFELGSDDDGWAYIDGTIAGALPGVHAVEATTFVTALTAGRHQLDLYMAERHTSGSGFWFRWNSDAVGIHACP